ncbi:transposase [Schlesneria sp. DSM 10557]|uniref:transposase n=1 Tax=Schlesneria sp. DSM 10557 TaxID=3044399 RepID=UPI0035A07CE2
MSLGKRESESQREFWLETDRLATGPGHVFYDKLNRLLREHGFDLFVEQLCQPHYKSGGRPSIPPGVYFRMLMIGYLEGIDSQRGIAWRCEDSLALRRFLGISLSEETPDHSSLTRIRDRLPLSVHEEVFQYILFVIEEQGLLKARTVGVDSTYLEANAAMKSIIRKDTGEDWKEYLKRLMKEEGLLGEGDDDPTDEELRRFDQQRAKRGKKKVSNAEWASRTDPSSKIVKMKDGRTHLGYKAEHVIDLESEVILSATVYTGTEGDSQTLLASVLTAQTHLEQSGSSLKIEEVVADKGYHTNEQLAGAEEMDLRTYIPKPKSRYRRRWKDKPVEQHRAVANNRRRMTRAKGKSLQRARSEKVERSFAHVCRTGGSRRTWLRGLAKINKRYLMVAATRNLGILMLKLFGMGKPRTLHTARGRISAIIPVYSSLKIALWSHHRRHFPLPATCMAF